VGDRRGTIGIGAKVVGDARSVALQMAEVAISKTPFAEILRTIACEASRMRSIVVA